MVKYQDTIFDNFVSVLEAIQDPHATRRYLRHDQQVARPDFVASFGEHLCFGIHSETVRLEWSMGSPTPGERPYVRDFEIVIVYAYQDTHTDRWLQLKNAATLQDRVMWKLSEVQPSSLPAESGGNGVYTREIRSSTLEVRDDAILIRIPCTVFYIIDQSA